MAENKKIDSNEAELELDDAMLEKVSGGAGKSCLFETDDSSEPIEQHISRR